MIGLEEFLSEGWKNRVSGSILHSDPKQGFKGPHELKSGRISDIVPHYINLMKWGIKPAAISDKSQSHQWDDAIKSGHVVFAGEVPSLHPGYNQNMHTVPGQEWRVRAMTKEVHRYRNSDRTVKDEDRYHSRMGVLLGYHKDDIRKFVNNDQS